MIPLTDKQLADVPEKVRNHVREVERLYAQETAQRKELEASLVLQEHEITRLTQLCRQTPLQQEKHRADLEAARFFMEQRLAGAIETINKLKAR